MKRIGLWSFDIYDEFTDFKTVKECALQIGVNGEYKGDICRAYLQAIDCVQCRACDFAKDDRTNSTDHISVLTKKVNRLICNAKE